jgi:putative transposase
LAIKIKNVFDQEKSRAGVTRIARIMRLNGWRAKSAKKYKATTNSNHRLPVAPSLLQQNFTALKPDEKYVSDITYIWTDEGWLYLAVVMDLYSRMVVGWAMSERKTFKLVVDALEMALWRCKMPRGVIIHSDRGSQYCSH